MIGGYIQCPNDASTASGFIQAPKTLTGLAQTTMRLGGVAILSFALFLERNGGEPQVTPERSITYDGIQSPISGHMAFWS